MDDRRKELSAAEIKAEKEAQYKRSLAYGIEKARASKARTQALKNTNFNKLDKLYTAINLLTAELVKRRTTSA